MSSAALLALSGLAISQPTEFSSSCATAICTSASWDATCCSAGKSLPWNIQPLANFRFGSVFRNAIPPKRDYSPPSYEDIFEKTIRQEKFHSESTTRRSHAIPQFDPFPNSQAFPETDRNSESTTANYFRSQLNAIQERNQQMLFGKEEPKISTTQRSTPRTTPRTTEMSLKKRREEQYLKAQQKLLQLQREQATRIKAQQSQSKLMQMVIAKQKELEERRRKKEQELKRREKEKEEKRRQEGEEESKRRFGYVRSDREGSMSQSNQNQYQTQFSNTNFDRYSAEEERKSEADQRRQQAEEKKKAYEEEKLRLQLEDERMKRQKEKEAALLKKQELEEKKRVLLEEMERRKAEEEEAEKARKKDAAYKEKLDRWRSKYQKLSLPTGQKFIDKSTETKILDSTKKKTEAIKLDKNANVASAGTSWPDKVAENELENRVGSSVDSLPEVKQKKKIGNPFTQEVCESLRVPCRFVTEHPCCKLPQRIELVGRPRAMDGSADLRWRFMQSRGRQAEGRMIEGFGSNRKSVSMQPVSSSFSVLSRPSSSIPYSHYTSKGGVSVPRYHYNGGPAVTSTILRQCWRLTYLNCARERDHPCCSLNSGGGQRSTNMLDRWLSRS